MKALEKILLAHKINYFGSESESQFDPNVNQEINEFRFSPMTLNECHFNMLLCNLIVKHKLNYLKLKEFNTALEIATTLVDTILPQEYPWIKVLMHIIHSALGKNEEGK